MEAGFIVILCMMFALGVATGLITERFRLMRSKPHGTIHVDYSDADGPYMFLESNLQVAELTTLRRAIFNVDVTHFDSQK